MGVRAEWVQAVDNWRVGPMNRSLVGNAAAATPQSGHSSRPGVDFDGILRAFRLSTQTPISQAQPQKVSKPVQKQSPLMRISVVSSWNT